MAMRPVSILAIVAGTLVYSVVVVAKGGPGTGVTTPDAPPNSTSSYAAWFGADFLDRFRCGTPTAEECLDAALLDTGCGRHFQRALLNTGLSACDALCPTPTVEQCRDDLYTTSMCGLIEQQKVKKEAPPECHDENPDTVCPPSGSACEAILRADIEAQQTSTGSALAADLPTRAVVIPESVDVTSENAALDRISLFENGYANPSNTVSSKVVPARYKNFNVSGTSRHYSADVQRGQAAYMDPTNPLMAGVRLLIEQRRAAYEANGTDVATCAEYVYEKYYDYTVFEDALRTPGSSSRDKWNVAFANDNSPAAIGARGATFEAFNATMPIRQYNGEALPLAVSFPAGLRPKNEFMATPVVDPAQQAQHLQYWNEATQTYTITIALANNLVVTLPRPIAFSPLVGSAGKVFLHDQSLANAILATEKVTEGWSYHRNMGVMFDENVDEEMAALDKVRETYPTLLMRRDNIASELGALFRSLRPKIPTLAVNGIPWDPTIYQDNFANELGSAVSLNRIRSLDDESNALFDQGFNIAASPSIIGASLLGAAINKNLGAGGVGGPMTTMSGTMGGSFTTLTQAGLQAASESFGGLFFALGDDGFSSVPGRIKRLMYALAEVEAEIEVALITARDVGCLVSDTFTTCDWSPKRFVQRVQDQFVAERDLDFATCMKFTQNDFSGRLLDAVDPNRFQIPLDGFLNVVVKYPKASATAPACDDGTYNESPAELERYFGCFETWTGEVIYALENSLVGANKIIDPETGAINPTETDSNGSILGDELFAVTHDYGVSWDVNGLDDVASQGQTEDDWCQLRPKFHGHFFIGGRFLGEKFELVDAAADVSTVPNDVVPNQAYLEIAGMEIISITEDDDGFDISKYNVIFEETYFEYTQFFELSQVFTIGPVWITVGGGMGGWFGAKAVGAAGTIPDLEGGCAQGVLGIEGKFEPFFGVDGFAFAGLDYYIVSAGIKISLVIIDLHFPFTVQLRFEGKALGGSPPAYDTRMRLVNNLDMQLKILDGQLSAFVEFCFILCESFEGVLFKWEGPRWDINIFKTTLDIPLGKLVDIQESISSTISGNLP